MGHGTWYYSLGVFLEIVDVFVRSEFEISSWRGARVDVRTYLLGGAIDSSEANGIIRDPKLELESSRFTFDLVHLSYESVDVVVGENWLLRHKAEMVCHEKVVKMPCVPKELVGFTPRRRIGFRMELVQGATPICEGSCRLTSLERQEVWNDCRSCKVRVGSNGNLLWEASVLLGRKKGGVRVAREDDRGVTKRMRKMLREVFQHVERSKEEVSRCGRNQMGNELILALPEGSDDFVVYYDALSKDLEACLEKGRRFCLIMLEVLSERDMESNFTDHGMSSLTFIENVVVGRRVRRRSEAKNEFEIDVRRSDLGGDYIEYGCASFEAWYGKECRLPFYGPLWVVEGLTLERCSTFGKKDKLEPSYVRPFEILRWIGLIVRLRIYGLMSPSIGNWIGRQFLFDELRVKVRWDSKRGPELTWERKDQMRSRELKRNGNVMVIIREVFVKLLLDSFGKLSISLYDSTLYVLLCYVLFITVIGFKGELHENTEVREILFLYCYAFSVSLLLTALCCDDIHDVTPRVSALAGCDRGNFRGCGRKSIENEKQNGST
ncbi:hypothetical protein Tco_0623430 [Tanacetum coccineum]